MTLYLATAIVQNRHSHEVQRRIHRIVETDKGKHHAAEMLLEHISQCELLHESEEVGYREAWEAITE